MSAPATNPLALPDTTMSARGGRASMAFMSCASSRITSFESTLADAPGLSIVSHATSSPPRSSFQLPSEVMAFRSLPDDPSTRTGGAESAAGARPGRHPIDHGQIADERQVIGELHLRDR